MGCRPASGCGKFELPGKLFKIARESVMARRILVLLLISSVAAMYPRGIRPVVRGGDPGAALSVAAAAADDEGAVCGEPRQAGPEVDASRRAPVANLPFPRETDAARGALDGSPPRGPATILVSLSDSLTISRPPPGGSDGI